MTEAEAKKASSVEFAAERESINIYRLENGDTIRLKTSVLRIIDTGQKNPDGTTQYTVRSNISMDVEKGD